jgi:hydrogenase maturation protease
MLLESVKCNSPMADWPKPSVSTLVVGLGNPLLGDDGVGFRVAESVAIAVASGAAQQAASGTLTDVEVDELAVGGIRLMERLIGYQRALIIDCINTGKAPRGTVQTLPLDALDNPYAGHLGSAHETSLTTALEMGRLLGATLPEEVQLVTIESPNVFDFSEQLSEPVEAAVPKAVRLVMRWLTKKDGEGSSVTF